MWLCPCLAGSSPSCSSAWKQGCLCPGQGLASPLKAKGFSSSAFSKMPMCDHRPCGVCVCAHACVHMLSRVRLFLTPWTVACQAPLSMEFSRQEYRSGQPFSTPGNLPDPGIEPVSLVSSSLAGGFFTTIHHFSEEKLYQCSNKILSYETQETYL